ncbi:hypothetical protein [Bradyrhizobium sp. BR 1433]|uniref:hypothetical protein n=1 Tax=Bradyrhizobium sp. BR 1433 TaxID=3447967 RepID=UPI003EE5B80A
MDIAATRHANKIGVKRHSKGPQSYAYVLSMILNVRLSKGGRNGAHRTYIESVKPVPVFRSISCQGTKTLMRIEKLEDHLDECTSSPPAERIGRMKEYVDLVFGSWTKKSL